MMAYKPYKPVPLAKRCPHGHDKFECGTCVSARDYWAKFDWKAYREKYPLKETP